jgi:hypothetical protein
LHGFARCDLRACATTGTSIARVRPAIVTSGAGGVEARGGAVWGSCAAAFPILCAVRATQRDTAMDPSLTALKAAIESGDVEAVKKALAAGGVFVRLTPEVRAILPHASMDILTAVARFVKPLSTGDIWKRWLELHPEVGNALHLAARGLWGLDTLKDTPLQADHLALLKATDAAGRTPIDVAAGAGNVHFLAAVADEVAFMSMVRQAAGQPLVPLDECAPVWESLYAHVAAGSRMDLAVDSASRPKLLRLRALCAAATLRPPAEVILMIRAAMPAIPAVKPAFSFSIPEMKPELPCVAAGVGNVALLYAMAQAGLGIHVRSVMLGSPAEVAATVRNVPCLRALRDLQALPQLASVLEVDYDAAALLLTISGADANEVIASWAHKTVLHQAILAGRADLVRLLLAAGADPNCSILEPAQLHPARLCLRGRDPRGCLMELLQSPALAIGEQDAWDELAAEFESNGMPAAARAIRDEAIARQRWGGLKRAFLSASPHFGAGAGAGDGHRPLSTRARVDGDADALVMDIAALLTSPALLREPQGKSERFRLFVPASGYITRFLDGDESAQHAERVRVLGAASARARARWMRREREGGSFPYATNAQDLEDIAADLAAARAAGALPPPSSE